MSFPICSLTTDGCLCILRTEKRSLKSAADRNGEDSSEDNIPDEEDKESL